MSVKENYPNSLPPGETLIDYYNQFRDFEVSHHEHLNYVLQNKQFVPFDCPNCGEQLQSLYLQQLKPGGKLEFWCRQGCYAVYSVPVNEVKKVVPQIKEVVR